jgi:hypothetical protein
LEPLNIPPGKSFPYVGNLNRKERKEMNNFNLGKLAAI